MRVASVLLALALSLTVSVPALAAQTKTSSKKTTSKKKKSSGRSSTPKQAQPTPERYREIQQALIDRGFLEGEPSGKWDEKSMEAWKRLERSESLPVDGKLDSKGLMALGLAPNRQVAEATVENP